MTRLIALDTETTGLNPETEDVFEVAMIDLATDHEVVVHLEPRPEVIENMHPKAAEVNRYHERLAAGELEFVSPEVGLETIRANLYRAHIMGAVPDFDARHLTSLFLRHGLQPPGWHYHIIDIEAMCVGYLARDGKLAHRPDFYPELPWKSDALSRLVGVEPPSYEDRHTALGDARWVRDLYHAITS